LLSEYFQEVVIWLADAQDAQNVREPVMFGFLLVRNIWAMAAVTTWTKLKHVKLVGEMVFLIFVMNAEKHRKMKWIA